MFEFAKLELRKDRDLFRGMAAIFLASLPLAALIARMNHFSVMQTLNATLLFWTFVGVPFIALFFGASGGSGLRREPWLPAEEPLPLAPLERVGGALLAQGGHLLVMVVFIAGAAGLLSFDLRQWMNGGEFPRVFILPFLGLEAFAVLYGFLLAFVLAYLVRNGTGGGAMALILTAIVTGSLGRSFEVHALYGPRAPMWPAVVFVGAVCLAAALKSLLWSARWVERSVNRGWPQGLKIAAVLAAVTFVAMVSGGVVEDKTTRSLQLAKAQAWIPWGLEQNPARPRSGDAALLESVDGSLAWVSPSTGVTAAFPRRDHTAHEILGRIYGAEIKSMVWDDQGRLWLLRRADAPGKWEVLAAKPGEKFVLKAALPAQEKRDAWLSVIGDCPALESRESSKSPTRFAQLGAGTDLLWKPREEVCRGARDPFATLDESGTVLSQRRPDGSRRSWRLPGSYAFRSLKTRRLLAPAVLGARSYYLLPVTLPKGGYGLAVCGEDGSVRLEWEMAQGRSWGFSFEAAPDGTLSDWFWDGERRELLLATKDGRFLPPFAVEGLPARGAQPAELSVVHEQDGRAWILYDEKLLIEVETGSGKLVRKWELPEPQPMLVNNIRRVEAVERGLFVRTPGALYFYDWQGARRAVRL